jgi:hypothetical protein
MRLFLFCFSLCIIACHAGSGQRTRSLSGTYAKASESEYSRAYDTLEITAYTDGGSIYVLAERNSYTELRGGKQLRAGQKHFQETAVFNPSTGELQGLVSGRLFIFSPEKSSLLAGAGVYQKIDEK